MPILGWLNAYCRFAVVALLASCGGGNSSQSSNGPPTSPAQPATISSTLSPSKSLTLELPGSVSLTFPAGFVKIESPITLTVSSGAEMDSAFNDGAMGFNITHASFGHILISNIVVDSLAGLPFEVAVGIDGDTEAAISAGHHPGIIVSAVDRSDDPEAGESIRSYDSVPASYDADRHMLVAPIPASVLSAVDVLSMQDAPTLQVVLKAVTVSPVTIVSKVASKSSAITTAPLPPEPTCGDQAWVSPLTEYTSIGAFGEGRGQDKHRGLDLTTRNPTSGKAETGHTVRAVADGYVSEVKSETCNCGSSAATCNYTDLDGYALTLTLNDGSTVVYRHLQRPGILLSGLADESTILTCYKNTDRTKYTVKAGDALALSGDNGKISKTTKKIAPHLHIEYLLGTRGKVNPLCRLVAPIAVPGTLSGAIADGQMLASTDLADKSGNVYLGRRKKGNPDVFVSMLAKPGAGTKFETDSDGDFGISTVSIRDPNIASIVRDYLDPAAKLPTDSGKIAVTPLANGSTSIEVTTDIPWRADSSEKRLLGDPLQIPVAVRERTSSYKITDISCQRQTSGTYNGYVRVDVKADVKSPYDYTELPIHSGGVRQYQPACGGWHNKIAPKDCQDEGGYLPNECGTCTRYPGDPVSTAINVVLFQNPSVVATPGAYVEFYQVGSDMPDNERTTVSTWYGCPAAP